MARLLAKDPAAHLGSVRGATDLSSSSSTPATPLGPADFKLVRRFGGGDIVRHRMPSCRFPLASARFYAAEVLLALEYLHMMGVVYRIPSPLPLPPPVALLLPPPVA